MQLFVVVLLSYVAVAAALAGCHGDRDKDNRPRQNCTAAGFSRVPAELEPSSQVLLFPNNLFSSLAWSSFQLFPQIYEVDLTGNQVPQVPPSGSPLLPTLRVLRLGSNRLSSLPDGCFSACPALTDLHLDHNSIRFLSDHTFAGLSRLETLELSSNHIQVLPALLLHPLSAIENLFLANNQIQVVPDDWFSQKEEVPYLDLSANPWACSCALLYLHGYLDDYGFNVYTRGQSLTSNPESVVCATPPRFHNQPVTNLSASELCPSTTPAPARPRTRTPTEAAAPTTDGAALTLAPPLTTTFITPPDMIVAPTTNQVRLTQTATAPVVIATRPEERPETRTSIPVADITTDQRGRTSSSWSQPDRHASPPGGGVTGLHPVTLAPPLATGSITATNTTTDQVPPTHAATFPVVIATRAEGRAVGAGLRGVAGVCFWLFAGCFLLGLLSAAIVMVTSSRVLVLYWTAYRPLKASLRHLRPGPAGLRLLTTNQRREEAGPRAGGQLYRSVLFIHRDEEEEKEEEKVPYYRRTMQRVVSREEELEGWRDVVEECGVSARPGRRSYSVILRQEAETEAEQLEWVLGAWEETTGCGAKGRLDLGLLS